MKKRTAAAYLELSVVEFEREVQAGRMPLPFKLGRGERWLRAAIDRYIEQMCEPQHKEWRKGLGFST